MEKLKVGVILGGMSSEKEVSLNSGRNVYDNLDREAYEAVPIFMDADGRLWVACGERLARLPEVDAGVAEDVRRVVEDERRVLLAWLAALA